MLSLLWQICDIIGLIFGVANGQILKNIPTIWLHWTQMNWNFDLRLLNVWKLIFSRSNIKKFQINFIRICNDDLKKFDSYLWLLRIIRNFYNLTVYKKMFLLSVAIRALPNSSSSLQWRLQGLNTYIVHKILSQCTTAQSHSTKMFYSIKGSSHVSGSEWPKFESLYPMQLNNR